MNGLDLIVSIMTAQADATRLRSEGLNCECCGRPLDNTKAVWLELDQRNGTYHNFGDIPEDRSQGCFPFGAECAKKQRLIAARRRA